MTIRHFTLLVAAFSAVALTQAHAQNPGFNHGDLILGFQSTGANSESYVLANLGQAGTLRDSLTNSLLTNVNSALIAQFGGSWFDRSDLYMGVATVGSNDEFSGFFVNGDPYNTLYVGTPRQSVGAPGAAQSFSYSLTPAQVQSAANGIFAMANIFETNGTGGISTILDSVSFVDYDDQNPITGGVQQPAYDGVFAGGVQTVFGAGTFGALGGVNAEAALDLYRVQGVNNQAGQFGFGQPVGQGTFEGTIVVDNAGRVSLIVVPEPSSIALLALGPCLGAFARRRRTST